MRRLVRIFFVTVLIGGIVCVGLVLFYYLQANNLVFFATGTKDKAFLDTTWHMSQNEVARATGRRLLPPRGTTLAQLERDLYPPGIMDPSRFQEREHRDFFLWGQQATVTYSFFDDRLYEVYVTLKGGKALVDAHKDIMAALEARAGVARPDKGPLATTIYEYTWESSRERISYWMRRDGKEAYEATIDVIHLPSRAEITDIIRNEQRTYFSK